MLALVSYSGHAIRMCVVPTVVLVNVYPVIC